MKISLKLYWILVEIIRKKNGEGLQFIEFEEIAKLLTELESSTFIEKMRYINKQGYLNFNWATNGIIISEETVVMEKMSELKSVFVIHGHDNELKTEVEAFLLRSDLLPVIISEEPRGGRTIIEQIEVYSNVSFAVVLLTPDDIGSTKGIDDGRQFRARQNVILELGYFIGKLGRDRVIALYRGDIELPSDYHGVLYIKLDVPNKDWRYELARELRAAGLPLTIK